MTQLMERARQRLTAWMAARPEITQTVIGKAVGHNQGWVSRFKLGEQDADIDELNAMARVFDHTLTELIDLQRDPKERDLLDAFRALRPEQRTFAIQMLQQLLPTPHGRGKSRGRNGE